MSSAEILGRRIYGDPIIVYTFFIDIMQSPSGGIVLSLLMDRFAKEDSFAMSDVELANRTHLNKGHLETAKKRIKDHVPFVTITRKGLPARTFYEIDWKLWFRVCGSKPGTASFPKFGKLVTEVPVKPGTSQSTEIRETGGSVLPRGHARNARSPSGVAPGRRDTTLEKHPRWVSYSNQLASSIQKVRNLNKKSNIRNWAYSFFRIHKDGVPIPRIKSVLDWYCKELEAGGDLIRNNPKYLCIAYTGQKFREKFDKLEGQMQRYQDQDLHENGPKVKIKLTEVKETKAEREARRKELG